MDHAGAHAMAARPGAGAVAQQPSAAEGVTRQSEQRRKGVAVRRQQRPSKGAHSNGVHDCHLMPAGHNHSSNGKRSSRSKWPKWWDKERMQRAAEHASTSIPATDASTLALLCRPATGHTTAAVARHGWDNKRRGTEHIMSILMIKLESGRRGELVHVAERPRYGWR